MSRSELIERVDAQIVAGRLAAGEQKFSGYLRMNHSTAAMLFNIVYDKPKVEHNVRNTRMYLWKGVPIYLISQMPDGEVEAMPTTRGLMWT